MDDDSLDFDTVPSTLTQILEPEAALAAAQRMQRLYQSSANGGGHSVFGRDGRRIEGRLFADSTVAEIAETSHA